jgi:hypothetical protein
MWTNFLKQSKNYIQNCRRQWSSMRFCDRTLVPSTMKSTENKLGSETLKVDMVKPVSACINTKSITDPSASVPLISSSSSLPTQSLHTQPSTVALESLSSSSSSSAAVAPQQLENCYLHSSSSSLSSTPIDNAADINMGDRATVSKEKSDSLDHTSCINKQAIVIPKELSIKTDMKHIKIRTMRATDERKTIIQIVRSKVYEKRKKWRQRHKTSFGPHDYIRRFTRSSKRERVRPSVRSRPTYVDLC